MAKVYTPADIIIELDAPAVTSPDDWYYHDAAGQVDVKPIHIGVPRLTSIKNVRRLRALLDLSDNPTI